VGGIRVDTLLALRQGSRPLQLPRCGRYGFLGGGAEKFIGSADCLPHRRRREKRKERSICLDGDNARGGGGGEGDGTISENKEKGKISKRWEEPQEELGEKSRYKKGGARAENKG